MNQLDYLNPVLDVFRRADLYDALFWVKSPEEYRFHVLVSDVFWWACADMEKIEPTDIELLEEALTDLGDDESYLLPELFAARKRKMRPQGAYYKELSPKAIALFNACGPERVIEIGNPKSITTTSSYTDEVP